MKKVKGRRVLDMSPNPSPRKPWVPKDRLKEITVYV
jgi:hypothetical protein